jgi:hypothetical protein
VSATETPWPYIRALLGPGLHWSKSPASVQAAIERAEREGQSAAADHLRIILERINVVGFITPEEKTPPG